MHAKVNQLNHLRAFKVQLYGHAPCAYLQPLYYTHDTHVCSVVVDSHIPRHILFLFSDVGTRAMYVHFSHTGHTAVRLRADPFYLQL